ncbi:MAG: amidohydrolase family protein [Gammaproteobacteria bacterium]|nr:MAG: amidohydrolase family protein [Gammaproteobacteria bacterium]
MTTNIARFHIMLAVLCVSSFAMAQGASYALTNSNLFNGVDDRIQENVTVFVKDGRIERIAKSSAAIPSGYEVIDCEGNYLMPGMFDVHTHINSLAQARRALVSGVTTVRTAGVPAFQDVSLRELVKAGKIPGPDVVAAGVFVTSNLGESVLADPRLKALAGGVNTDEDFRLLVKINADRGVDVIKTRGTQRAGLPETDPRQQVYTERQLRVIVDAAARHGLPVMIHAHGDAGARAAVLAGARSIEHGTYLSDETIRLMKERGTWFVPTYVTIDENKEEHFDYVLRLRAMSMLPQLERAIREAHRQGVKIATGADNYYDTVSINRISIEVEHFVRMGMSNFEALQSATVVSAGLLQVEDQTGRIAAGFEADMILVPANPLTDIAALQDVLLVMSNGQIAVKRIPFGKTE